MKRDYDHLFKIVLIGDSSVGKSSLLVRFSDDTFNQNYITTIGVDFRFRTLPIEKKNVKLQIVAFWDTAGQQRYRTITNAYYRGADAIMIIFDIGNKSSFTTLPEWLQEVDKYSGPDVTRIIIANKSDLEKREVTQEDIQKFQHDTGLKIMEASAKTSLNVDEAFIAVTRSLISRKELQDTRGKKPQNGVKVSYSSTKKSGNGISGTYDGFKDRCCSN